MTARRSPRIPLDAAARQLARELAAIPRDEKEWAAAEELSAQIPGRKRKGKEQWAKSPSKN